MMPFTGQWQPEALRTRIIDVSKIRDRYAAEIHANTGSLGCNVLSVMAHLLLIQGRLEFGERLAIPSNVRQLAKNVNVMDGVKLVTYGRRYVTNAPG